MNVETLTENINFHLKQKYLCNTLALFHKVSHNDKCSAK